MKTPQFKSNNTAIISENRMSVGQMREINSRSLLMLHLSQALLCLGFVLIFFDNLNIFASNSYFGSFNWMTITVFAIGFIIIFVFIPWLYFSSFQNFKQENDFWDKETFWIMPLFFFGAFFIYGNKSTSLTFSVLLVLIITIAIIHCRFYYLSSKFAAIESIKNLADYRQYNITLKYLTAYYILFIILVIFYKYSLLQKFSL